MGRSPGLIPPPGAVQSRRYDVRSKIRLSPCQSITCAPEVWGFVIHRQARIARLPYRYTSRYSQSGASRCGSTRAQKPRFALPMSCRNDRTARQAQVTASRSGTSAAFARRRRKVDGASKDSTTAATSAEWSTSECQRTIAPVVFRPSLAQRIWFEIMPGPTHLESAQVDAPRRRPERICDQSWPIVSPGLLFFIDESLPGKIRLDLSPALDAESGCEALAVRERASSLRQALDEADQVGVADALDGFDLGHLTPEGAPAHALGLADARTDAAVRP